MNISTENNQAGNNEVLIDFNYLNEITGGDEELRNELIAMFESETIIQLAQIREASSPLDSTRLKQAIHKYRSSLFSVGLLSTALKYKEIETQLKEGKIINGLPETIANLEVESQSGLTALKQL